MSLTVVYGTDTGHVLGALALAGPAGPPPAVADLVGKELPLRVATLGGRPFELGVPAARLGAVAADDEPDALAAPLDFGVELGADGTPKPALRRLADGVTVSVAAGGVTVALPDDVSAVTRVLVLVAGESGTRLEPGDIGTGNREVTVRMTLGAGAYGVLALVEGWAGHLGPATVS